MSVQVKARATTTSVLQRDRFLHNVSASTFKPRRDLYILFVAVDVAKGTMVDAWLVPSKVLDEKTKPNSQGKHRFSASTKPRTRDQWSRHRLDPAELPGRILTHIDGLASRRS